MSISTRVLRLSVAVYFAALTSVLSGYEAHNARTANGWAVGEWLINYSGGFIRRGFAGTVLLFAGRVSHLPLPYLSAGAQILVYSVLLVLVYLLVRRLPWEPVWVALLFSPATFAFPVLDPPAALRKEILLFTSMAATGVWLLSRRRPDWQIAIVILLLSQAVVLSHEASLLFMPYFLALVFLAHTDWRRAAWTAAPAASLLPVSAIAIARHPGNAATAKVICRSVGGTWSGDNLSLCGGAIAYLRHDLTFAKQDLVHVIAAYHYYLLYGTYAVLALAPAAWLLARFSAQAEQRYHSICVLIAFLLSAFGSLVLFRIGTDWGRWIYMHTMCLTMLLLFMGYGKGTGVALRVDRRTIPAWALVFAYCLAWTLPAVGQFPGRFGYYDLLRYFLNYGGLHPASANLTF